MSETTYSEKLRDPRWQKKRLEILQRDNFTCLLCGDKETELHIHHEEYIRGRKPWEYENSKLKTLCKHCHFIVEHFKASKETVLLCRKVAYEDDYVEFYVVVLAPVFFEDEDKEIEVRHLYLTDNKDVDIRHKYSKDEIKRVSDLFFKADILVKIESYL
jgi:hypothetical protein